MKILAKIFLLAIITCNLQLETSNCHAQYVTLTDSTFISWLRTNGFSSCMKGDFLDTSCAAIQNATTVNCSSKNIKSINGIQYFKILDTLICSSNNLSLLPELPSTITYLDCSYNQLTGLRALPVNLAYLDCSENLLKGLPFLPIYVSYLDCSYNQLTDLPSLPDTLLNLFCNNNQLTSLPALPDSMYWLDIFNNPNLSCLPQINTIATFYFDSTNIQCVRDYGNVGYSEPVISSVPLCSSYNPSGCLPAGVSEITVNSNQLTVFPNPASGSFTISCSEELNDAVVEIYNVLGGKVSSIKYQNSHLTGGQARLMTIDISYLPAGMYFVRVSNGQQQFNEKLIVQ